MAFCATKYALSLEKKKTNGETRFQKHARTFLFVCLLKIVSIFSCSFSFHVRIVFICLSRNVPHVWFAVAWAPSQRSKSGKNLGKRQVFPGVFVRPGLLAPTCAHVDRVRRIGPPKNGLSLPLSLFLSSARLSSASIRRGKTGAVSSVDDSPQKRERTKREQRAPFLERERVRILNTKSRSGSCMDISAISAQVWRSL